MIRRAAWRAVGLTELPAAQRKRSRLHGRAAPFRGRTAPEAEGVVTARGEPGAQVGGRSTRRGALATGAAGSGLSERGGRERRGASSRAPPSAHPGRQVRACGSGDVDRDLVGARRGLGRRGGRGWGAGALGADLFGGLARLKHLALGAVGGGVAEQAAETVFAVLGGVDLLLQRRDLRAQRRKCGELEGLERGPGLGEMGGEGADRRGGGGGGRVLARDDDAQPPGQRGAGGPEPEGAGADDLDELQTAHLGLHSTLPMGWGGAAQASMCCMLRVAALSPS